jgi:hypothetical protein
MDEDFISEEGLLTFAGWLRYQGVVDPAPDELEMRRDRFDEAVKRHMTSPKVGLMKLQRVPCEQKYAIAIRDESKLWLTMWVRCSRKGEIFIMYPRGDRDWDAHASYHLDGTLHQKSYAKKMLARKRQPLTAAFRGSEHLGAYAGHGSGAIYDPTAFDGAVIVGPGILGPKHGSVTVDLVEPGHVPKADTRVAERKIFPRGNRPSVVVSVCRADQMVFLNWPDDFKTV